MIIIEAKSRHKQRSVGFTQRRLKRRQHVEIRRVETFLIFTGSWVDEDWATCLLPSSKDFTPHATPINRTVQFVELKYVLDVLEPLTSSISTNDIEPKI